MESSEQEATVRNRLENLTNRIVSGTATIIAIVALVTAVYQAKLSRDQAKASVWPYLLQGNSGNEGYFRIIQNVGLGPAIIRAFEVLGPATLRSFLVQPRPNEVPATRAPEPVPRVIFRAPIPY